MLIRSQRLAMRGLRLSQAINRLSPLQSPAAFLLFPHPTLSPFAATYLPVHFFTTDERKKIERTIRILREDLERQARETQQSKSMQLVPKPALHIRVWNKVRDPAQLVQATKHMLLHYYHGFRLFLLEARLSLKYLWKLVVKGGTLSRREREQLIRTTADVIRLVPFSVFIIVPFMEFLFPFYIKFFPQMMPSTFQDLSKEQEKQMKQLKAKIETAQFLQDTLEEISEIKKGIEESSAAAGQASRAYEFAQFLKKVRTEEGGYVSNVDLFKFVSLFEDELTLDNLSLANLRALCRLLSISKLGTPEILRYRLNLRLRELQADDKLIKSEGGVEVLSAQELQAACRARGMRALGLSEERLKRQLKQWLELSQNDKVPPSLLLLSRAMFFPETLDYTARLRSIVSSLPQEIGEHVALNLKELEGDSDPKAKIELLRKVEKALREERKAEQSAKAEEESKTDSGEEGAKAAEKEKDKNPPKAGNKEEPKTEEEVPMTEKEVLPRHKDPS